MLCLASHQDAIIDNLDLLPGQSIVNLKVEDWHRTAALTTSKRLLCRRLGLPVDTLSNFILVDSKYPIGGPLGLPTLQHGASGSVPHALNTYYL